MRPSNLSPILFMMLAGCASLPSSPPSVPEERLLLNSARGEADSAEIVVIRDGSIAGSACYYAIYVDDKLAVRIGSGEKAALRLEPGERKLKVTRDPEGEGLCSSGGDMTERQVILENSEKKYFRLSMSFSGWPRLESLQAPAETL